MASIYEGIIIGAAAEQVRAALRDVGAAHERFAPGRVVADRSLARPAVTSCSSPSAKAGLRRRESSAVSFRI
ncbi:MAG TPA: hypothetical protein VMB83_14705 [Roseiarcus sp.]|nr:hypothetical protein [Roseiarcus sp.]